MHKVFAAIQAESAPRLGFQFQSKDGVLKRRFKDAHLWLA